MQCQPLRLTSLSFPQIVVASWNTNLTWGQTIRVPWRHQCQQQFLLQIIIYVFHIYVGNMSHLSNEKVSNLFMASNIFENWVYVRFGSCQMFVHVLAVFFFLHWQENGFRMNAWKIKTELLIHNGSRELTMSTTELDILICTCIRNKCTYHN